MPARRWRGGATAPPLLVLVVLAGADRAFGEHECDREGHERQGEKAQVEHGTPPFGYLREWAAQSSLCGEAACQVEARLLTSPLVGVMIGVWLRAGLRRGKRSARG